MVHVEVMVEMPDSELEAFLQVLRGWDKGRDTIHMAISVEAPQMRPEELRAIYARLKPPFPYGDEWRRS
jgi:hypothetical protein